MTLPVSGTRPPGGNAMFDDTSSRKKLVEVHDLKMHFPIYAGLLRRHVGRCKGCGWGVI